MRSANRLLLLSIFVVLSLTVATASACEDSCSTCVAGWCLYCKNGYYASGGSCKPCASDNCAHCEVAGYCLSCDTGYKLKFVSVSIINGVQVDRRGICEKENKCDPNCETCVEGTCAFCKSGYYSVNGVCESCRTENCAFCKIAGRCLSCQQGYSIDYVQSDGEGVSLSKWGICTRNSAASVSRWASLFILASLFLYVM